MRVPIATALKIKNASHRHQGKMCPPLCEPEQMGRGLPLPASGDGSPSSLIARMEEGNSKLLESERKLQEERHRTVVLEQHLEKMRLEPGRTSTSQRAASRSKAGRAGRGSQWLTGRRGLVADGGAGQQPHSAPWGERGKQRLCLPLVLSVLFPWPPSQNQEPQSTIGPGGPGPPHLGPLA